MQKKNSDYDKLLHTTMTMLLNFKVVMGIIIMRIKIN